MSDIKRTGLFIKSECIEDDIIIVKRGQCIKNGWIEKYEKYNIYHASPK